MNDAMKALDALKRIGGCAAHACIVAPPQGAGTNGQCTCLDSRSKRGRIEAVFKMMRAALEANAMDSARYRHVRTILNVGFVQRHKPDHDEAYNVEVDAAVDAAIKEHQ